MSRRKLDRTVKWLILIWMLLTLLLFATLLAAQGDGSPTNEDVFHGPRSMSAKLLQLPSFSFTQTNPSGLPMNS
jgi:hypothetical protein